MRRQTTIKGDVSGYPSRQKIRTWINRQRTLPNPSPVYLEWLRKQFRIECQPTVIKKEAK